MKKSISFMKWVTRNTWPLTHNQVYYNNIFYYTDGRNHKDRNDLKELYQLWFKLEGHK